MDLITELNFIEVKSKNKECTICHKDDQPWFSKKRCKRCATIQDSKGISRSSIQIKITKQTAKNKLKRSTERAGYGEFFQRMIQRIIEENICCENCGVRIQSPSSFNIAHILGKSKHPEVATEENNILFLCHWENQCHANFDSSLSKRFSMTVAFSAAIKKYQLFKHLITNHSKENSQLENDNTNI